MADMKFPLGSDRYLVVSKWKGQTRISLREYVSYDGSDKLYPTKKGIALTVDNWIDLKLVFDEINALLSTLSIAEQVDYKHHIGSNVFVTVKTGWPNVDIRSWWLPEDANDIVPTKRGISLRASEWEKLNQIAESLHKVVPELAYAIPCSMRGDHQNQQGMLACSHCNPNSCADWKSIL